MMWPQARRYAIGCVCWGGAAATALGFAGGSWWILDLFSHFRVQYLVVLGIAAVAAALYRGWLSSAIAATASVINAAVVIPLWLPHSGTATGETLSVLSFNVQLYNRDFDQVAQYLRGHDHDAEVFLFFEVDRGWLDALRGVLGPYEVISQPRDDGYGFAVFSRLPVEAASIRVIHREGPRAVELVIRKRTKSFRLLGVHMQAPVSRHRSTLRDAMFETVTSWARRHGDASAIVGDLNATPWSYPLRRFLSQTGWRSGQSERGIHTTWPGPRLLWALWIPIDDCLHTPDLLVDEFNTGPFLGSDHRPIQVSIRSRAR